MVMSYDMPEDVVVEILSRLRVKSLMRFWCVCKSWFALAKDESFIAKHLKQQEADNKKNGCLLFHNYVEETNQFVFSLCADETFALPSYQYPDLAVNADAILLGSCNGIVCLFNRWDAMALWNPAMRQFRTLPCFPHPDLPPYMVVSYRVFGFGFDPKTSDYKVIWIRVFVEEDDGLVINPSSRDYNYKQVGVYTMRNDSWRELNGNTLLPAHYIDSSYFHSYANGFYYWLASEKRYNSMLILSFDMADEVFRTIPAPSLPESEFETSWHKIAFYNDSIALILYDHSEEDRYYNIWVMKEKCWSIQVTIGPLLEVEAPIGFWKDGGLLLQRRDTIELVLANLITAETTYLLGTDTVVWAFVYCDSLVSVKRGTTEYKGRNDAFDHAEIPDFFDVPFIVKRIKRDAESSDESDL